MQYADTHTHTQNTHWCFYIAKVCNIFILYFLCTGCWSYSVCVFCRLFLHLRLMLFMLSYTVCLSLVVFPFLYFNIAKYISLLTCTAWCVFWVTVKTGMEWIGIELCSVSWCDEINVSISELMFRSFTCSPSEACGEVPLRGGQHPVRGWGEARRRSAEDVREVWLQGVFSARSEPRRDHQLPLHHDSVPRAGTVAGLSQTRFLHRGTWVTLKFEVFSLV